MTDPHVDSSAGQPAGSAAPRSLSASLMRLILIEGALLAVAAILLVVTQNVIFVYLLIAIAVVMGPFIIWTIYQHQAGGGQAGGGSSGASSGSGDAV